MANQNFWQTIGSQVVYQNPYFSVREDTVIRPDGKPGMYAVVEKSPSVFVVALTEANEVYLIGQYRYTTQRYSWELPAGGTDGENALQAAQRELQEETGLVSDNWEEAGSYNPLNGSVNTTAYVYVARNVKQTMSHQQEEEGITSTVALPVRRVFEMILSGEISDGETIASLTKVVLKLGLL
jgi:ADP-ribose pyrophosphatase YjhB (NUDIX family)